MLKKNLHDENPEETGTKIRDKMQTRRGDKAENR
jgi:hypothetical protein